MSETLPSETIEQNLKHSVVGKVISNKMNKTIVVSIERLVKHPKYKKYMRRQTKLVVHDENNICKEGDLVKIQQTAPKSKRKTWQLFEVLNKK